ncbi:RHS repeat-associated core domain-containing protein [Microcoleus sp. AT8-A4]
MQEVYLVGVQNSNGDAISYAYDADGVRVSKTVNGVTTDYLVDDNRDYAQVLEEYVNDALTASYVYGLDLISQERGNADSFYLVDGLGSTRGLANASGGVTDTYTYDAFGNLIASAGATANNYLFAGEQFDSNLGDYYLRQRYYDTDTGRFTRRDTYEGSLENPITLHKYLYGNANPVTYTDPTGLFSMADFGAANAIRDILMSIQLDTGSGLINALLGDGDVNPSEWGLNQLTSLFVLPALGMVFSHGLGKIAQSLPRFFGNERVFAHFTSAEAIKGITGISISRLKRLKVGETVVVRKLKFKKGTNAFNTQASNDVFVTELQADATSGQLNQVGVFGDRQNFVIQFSGDEMMERNGILVRGAMLSNGGSIFSIPAAGRQLHGQFLVTKVRE